MHLDAGDPARHPARRAARRGHHRRLQPRALHPRPRTASASRCSARPAAWSPRWSRSCAPARAPGSPTAAARPTARWSTATTASRCRRTSPPTSIRRVWLTAEEEAGYYYGFANEGLWPLCHIAHVRPTFRSSDWAHYVAVNRKFADAVVERGARPRIPIVLVQDYHFALLPRMIRERAARGDDHHLLAHPVAQPGVLRHLPVARGDARRAAGQQHPRLPHPVPLQQLRRHGRPLPRGARRPRDVHRHPAAASCTAGPPLPDLDRVAAGAAGDAAGASPTAGATCAPGYGLPRRASARRRRRPPRLHQGHHGALPRRRAPARAESASGSAASPSSRSPRRRAPGSTTTSDSRGAGRARWPTRSTTASARGGRRRSSCSGRAPRAATTSTSTTAPPTSASSAACTTA